MAERIRGYAHRVDIAGDVRAVWRAFTEVPHLGKWCAPDAQIVEDLYLDRLRAGKPIARAELRRFRIDLSSRRVVTEQRG